jgi:hypothetical protein
MSNLNNVYGVSNGCPSIMNDGRGVKTNFNSSRQLTLDLKQQLNATTSFDFRQKLQQYGTDIVNKHKSLDISEFSCKNVPDGNITINENINLTTQGGSYLSQFKN